MSVFRLLWAGIWRRKGRTILTLLSIVNAFLLMGLLFGFGRGVDNVVTDTRSDILVTYSRISQIEPLPMSHRSKIESVRGVTSLTPALVFRGSYANFKQPVAAFAVDARRFLDVYPKMGVMVQQIDRLARARSGALVSVQMAETYGWKVGDRVPLRSSMWLNRDGTPIWPVDIVGIYTPNGAGAGGNPMLLNYDYLDQGRASANGTTSFFFMKIASGEQAGRIAADIDRQFANSLNETKTVTESQLSQDALRQIGDIHLVINAVVGAALLALLLSISVIFSQAMRERTPEIAVLKTLGFSDGFLSRLILGEALAICLTGAVIGLGFAVLLFPVIERAVGLQLEAGPVLVWGLLLAVIIALLAGFMPSWRARSLQVVDALSGR